jgi:HTH-type transcriptional regulator/antitoxin HipB
MLIRSPRELALLVVSQRKKLKLSQTAVGKLVGLKQQTVSDFENNPEGTKLKTIFHILSAVQLDLKAFTKDEPASVKTKWKKEW